MNVLFLHGFLGAPSMWDAVGVDGARFVLPGHGASTRPPAAAPLGANGFTDAVDAIASEMREPALVVGYSMGARLALGLTLRRPALVCAAVLIGAHPGIDDVGERADRVRWDDAQADAILVGGLPAFVDAWERLPLFATQRELPAALRAEERTRRLSHTNEGAAWAMRALGLGRQPSLWDALRTCRTPITFLAGALDTKFVGLGGAAARVAPHATFRAVPGAGHNLALETPAAVAGAIRALLASTSISDSHERKHA